VAGLYEGRMKLSDISMGQMDEQEMGTISGLGYLGQNQNPAIAAQIAQKQAAQAAVTPKMMAEAQKLLLELGYPVGAADGQLRNRTKLAISVVQKKADTRSIRGVLDGATLLKLRSAAAGAKSNSAEYNKLKATADEIKSLNSVGDAVIGTAAAAASTAAAPAPAPAPASATTSTAIVPAQGVTTPAATEPLAPATAGGGYDFAAMFKNPMYWVGVAAVVGVGIWWYMRKRAAPVAQMGEVETLALEGAKPKRKRRKRKSKK